MKILHVSAGWIHPPYRGRQIVKQTLGELPGLSSDEVASLAEAVRGPMREAAALVLYYHHGNVVLEEDALTAFRDFVAGGGGILAIHSATASYKPTPAYFPILGGRFIGHGPVREMEIRPVAGDDPLFAGIAPFTVRDELYRHELQPDIRVHFETDDEGETQPMVWTREEGRGRVCYVCPGHRSASMEHPAVQEILRRGLKWVAGA